MKKFLFLAVILICFTLSNMSVFASTRKLTRTVPIFSVSSSATSANKPSTITNSKSKYGDTEYIGIYDLPPKGWIVPYRLNYASDKKMIKCIIGAPKGSIEYIGKYDLPPEEWIVIDANSYNYKTIKCISNSKYGDTEYIGIYDLPPKGWIVPYRLNYASDKKMIKYITGAPKGSIEYIGKYDLPPEGWIVIDTSSYNYKTIKCISN